MSRLRKELTEGGIMQVDSARLSKHRWGDRLRLGDPRDSEHFCMAIDPSLSFMTVVCLEQWFGLSITWGFVRGANSRTFPPTYGELQRSRV